VAYAYDFTLDKWEELPTPATARAFGAGGGCFPDRVFTWEDTTAKKELKTPARSTSHGTTLASLRPHDATAQWIGLVTLGNRLQAVGGGWDTYLGFSERYDSAHDRWTAFETPIVGEWRNLGLATWNSAILRGRRLDGDYNNRMYRLDSAAISSTFIHFDHVQWNQTLARGYSGQQL
jgi:hypothetical protein